MKYEKGEKIAYLFIYAVLIMLSLNCKGNRDTAAAFVKLVEIIGSKLLNAFFCFLREKIVRKLEQCKISNLIMHLLHIIHFLSENHLKQIIFHVPATAILCILKIIYYIPI